MMKAFLVSTLFLLLTVSCQPETVNTAPEALVGKTWVRQSGTYQLQTNWPDGERYYNQYPLLIEFDQSGKMRYGADKQTASCCAPYSYRSDGSNIRFAYDDPNPDPRCALLNCVLSELTAEITWQVETLTSTTLIIKTDKQRIVFAAQ